MFKTTWERLNPSVENLKNQDTPTAWERKLLERVITASLIENRRARRWRIFFQFIAMVYVVLIMALAMPDQIQNIWAITNPHTSVIDIEGVIADDSNASADKIVQGLRKAFEDTQTKGIILRINSPGGSPVQASYIYDEIRRLRTAHTDIPIYAVIVDMGASGAYYIAAATDAIYADRASLVGSIGVLMNGFGFVKTLQDYGVERRLLTAGEHKGILDPFSPLKEQDKVFAQDMLQRIHKLFINAVKDGRKGKLKDDPSLFSGLFWTGEEAKTLGLIDDFGSSGHVARDIIGAEKIVNYTYKESLLQQFSEQVGTRIANIFLSTNIPHFW